MMLVMLLTTGPESRNTQTAVRLTETFLRRGGEVTIFLMSEGVLQSQNPDVSALIEQGAKIELCEHDAGGHGIERSDDDSMRFCSLIDLAVRMREADKLICLS